MLPFNVPVSVLVAAALGTSDPGFATSGVSGFDELRLQPADQAETTVANGLHDAVGWHTDEAAAKGTCARFIWWSRTLPAYRIRICVQPTGPAPDPEPLPAKLRF